MSKNTQVGAPSKNPVAKFAAGILYAENPWKKLWLAKSGTQFCLPKIHQKCLSIFFT